MSSAAAAATAHNESDEEVVTIPARLINGLSRAHLAESHKHAKLMQEIQQPFQLNPQLGDSERVAIIVAMNNELDRHAKATRQIAEHWTAQMLPEKEHQNE